MVLVSSLPFALPVVTDSAILLSFISVTNQAGSCVGGHSVTSTAIQN
jgi:hypothetical protein